MSAAAILSRLAGVKKTTASSWMSQCPAHPDRDPSLSIREGRDGKVLLHCFAGCETDSVLAAIGMDLRDLFPSGEGTIYAERIDLTRRQWAIRKALHFIEREMMIVALAGEDFLAGRPLNDADRSRLAEAIAKIRTALEATE